jgi:hypothetical protein
MRTQLEQRLKQLKAEYESGQKLISDLDNKIASTRETLLRISGAIKIIEDELIKGFT